MDEHFRRILAEYQNRVYNQAFRMLGSREDAEEATQDVFLRIHRGLNAFRGTSKVSTWIFSITANICISRLRRKRHLMVSLDEEFSPDGGTLADIIPADFPDPGKIFENAEICARVRNMVSGLPPKWAMAISLFHFDELSYEEIAAAMDIPKATVATYILRGRRQLAIMLANCMRE